MELINVNNKTFRIIELLGKGKGGYSYLATDGERRYVLKQIHHEPCDYYQFGNKIEAEIRDYERLKKLNIRMPEMYDVDVLNERILKEYIEGETIAKLALRGEVKDEYIKQVKEMCGVLYPAGLNIDYYPTNFVVQDGFVYYIDYECNTYMDEWNFENWGLKCWLEYKEQNI